MAKRTWPTKFYAEGLVPRDYKCDGCGAHGCKLWREYQTFADHTVLECARCALKSQNETGSVDADGRRETQYGRTDQIGWRIPAVPCEDDGSSYWGYTSVPNDGVNWWRKLPTELPRG